jgi:KDO2-lipid IV(A) lauroyltransferase
MRKSTWLVWAEFLPVAALLPLVALLPHRLGLALSRALGLLAYAVLGTYRAVVRINLDIAFGCDALGKARVRELSRDAFVNALQTFFELARLSRMDRNRVVALTLEPEGYEQYREALAQGRGVIAVSGHFGNWYWPVMCAAMEGFTANVIVRPLDNPLLDRLMGRVFQRWGIRVIPRRQSVMAALTALRRGETVALMVDQNAALHGRFVPFFGIPAATMQGLPWLRRGSGAEVVAIHSRRIGRRHLVTARWLRDLPQDPDACLLAVNRQLEAVIAADPGQYFWLHPRWKTRPPGEPSRYPGLRV